MNIRSLQNVPMSCGAGSLGKQRLTNRKSNLLIAGLSLTGLMGHAIRKEKLKLGGAIPSHVCTKKNGMLSSHGIRRKDLRSI